MKAAFISMMLAAAALAQSPLPAVPPKVGPGTSGQVPPALRQVGITQKLNQQIPLDLTFLDEDGRRVHLSQYFGKRPVVLTLVYYDCPMLCTMVLNGLVRAMRAMEFTPGQDFEIVTVSFDPRDKHELAAAKKREYVKAYRKPGGDTGWHFLVGDDANIRPLAESVGFRYTWDEQSQQFAHASGIMILTPDGHVSRYYYGLDYAARDLRLSLVEASAGKIGNTADEVLLYCFHYDPVTGKYGVAIMNLMRVAGGATVLLLGGFMFFSIRGDIKAKSASQVAGENKRRSVA